MKVIKRDIDPFFVPVESNESPSQQNDERNNQKEDTEPENDHVSSRTRSKKSSYH